ncbi:MAG TPA: SDR family oxidoreductase [Ktedonobacterales bacterium]|nr:SDR family oxidoreductase [Ktedonobacterales bacterium]
MAVGSVSGSRQMDGRVCVVTGATSGIGYVTARELARRGATVTVVGRNRDRTARCVAQIRQETGSEAVDSLLADLSSMTQVRALAEAVKARHTRLDVLVNNAGAIFLTRHTTVDGYEMTFALNHLAPFLLTNLLLDRLKASVPARIVTTASVAHTGAKIAFDDPNFQHSFYNAWSAYSQSKLANIMFTYELARRLEGTGVTANAFHPGVVASGFAHNGPLLSVAMTLARPMMVSAEEGAKTAIYVASSPAVEGVTGQYFTKEHPVRSSKESYNTESQRRLWEVSEELTGVQLAV